MATRLLWLSIAAIILVAVGTSSLLAQEPEVRAVWVDSFNPGLRSPSEIDQLIARVKLGNLNTIIAQVRRNAQSLYANSLEGWVENYVPPDGFDPLQDLVQKAHQEGIEVHAWVNIGPIYSGHPLIPTASWPCAIPCNRDHVFNRHGWGHPDGDYWLTKTHPLYQAGTHANFPGERTSSGTWWLDLGHPAAAQYTLDVLLHLLSQYDLDGLHLDYIRYPEMPITKPPFGGLSFSTGYNPVSVRRFNASYGLASDALPDPWDPDWSQWRRDQVQAIVRRLYLEAMSIRPQARLTAALITFYRGPNQQEPRTFQQTEAYTRVFQDWNGWMREGILDWSIPMIYKSQHLASHQVQFEEWINFTKIAQYNRHGVIGLGAFINSLENTIAQIASGREPALSGERTRGFNFFSYNATNGMIPEVPARPQDEFFRALSENDAYGTEAPFPAPTTVPAMSWKARAVTGHLLAEILDADGKPADGARVTILKVGSDRATARIVQYADGNGYVGAVDLEPGEYQLLVDLPARLAESINLSEPVVAGRVTRHSVNLRSIWYGPFVRDQAVFSTHGQWLDQDAGASALEEWQTREPVPENILADPKRPRPN